MTAGAGLDRLRQALTDHGCNPRGSSARCPAHDDRTASLSIGQGREGAVINCHAGCDPLDVVAELGLDWADLFDQPPERPGGSDGPGWTVVEEYTYRDEERKPLFTVQRRSPKGFRQWHPGPDGSRVWDLKGVRRVLYRLPEVIAAVAAGEPVYVVEGEKDVHAIEAAGGVATTAPGGAGKWRPEYAKPLSNGMVIIVADADAAGQAHAEQVRASLARVASSVTIVRPAEGKDAHDHLAAGHGLDDFRPGEPPAEQLTEEGYARRLLAAHGDAARYVHPWRKWFTWDTRRWARDDRQQVTHWARTIARQVTIDALDGPAARLTDARRHERRSAITGAIALAGTEPGVALVPADFDSWPQLLNTPGGTLDLDLMEIRPHAREDHLTKITRGSYDPARPASSTLWEEFLERILPDAAIRAYLARIVGQAIFGTVTEHLLPVGWGTGANGKTTLFEAIAWALGDYAGTADPEIILAQRHAQHPTTIAALFGLRLVLLHETDEGRRMAEATVKRLTGGDKITARRMREDPWEFDPAHTFVMFTNHRPIVSGSDDAMWRRLKLINFSQTIPEGERDRDLGLRLRAEADAILAWIIGGYLDWRDHGLQDPPEVIAATDRWRQESDAISQWIAAQCETFPASYATTAELYTAWESWAEGHGLDARSRKWFSQALVDHGYGPPEHTRRGATWRGLGLARERDADTREQAAGEGRDLEEW
jgi:putative DNA primase/helicase